MAKTKLAAEGKPYHHITNVIEGTHSTRTEYDDGSVKFVTHWRKLMKDVRAALAIYDAANPVAKKKVRKSTK